MCKTASKTENYSANEMKISQYCLMPLKKHGCPSEKKKKRYLFERVDIFRINRVQHERGSSP